MTKFKPRRARDMNVPELRAMTFRAAEVKEAQYEKQARKDMKVIVNLLKAGDYTIGATGRIEIQVQFWREWDRIDRACRKVREVYGVDFVQRWRNVIMLDNAALEKVLS